MKRILFLLLAIVGFQTLMMAQPLYRFYVWLRSGAIESYAIEERPLVTLGDELFTLTTTAIKVDYAAKDVLQFTLSDSTVDDPTLGIGEQLVVMPEVTYRAGELRFVNYRAEAPIKVFDAEGRLVSSLTVGSDGVLSISLGSYPAGMYIVKTEQSSYKIIKK